MEDEILKGKLRCQSCRLNYLIIDGIPRMKPDVKLEFSENLWRILYNLYAPFYDRVEGWLARRMGFREEELREKVVNHLKLGGGERIAEICIGTGGNIPYLLRYNPSVIYGIDFSEGMLRICMERVKSMNLKNVELVLGLAQYLPFKENLFDAVLNLGGITYFSDKKKAIEEMFRIAKPGARIVICEQTTILEKILGKDKPPINLFPENVKLKLEYLYNRRFYLIRAIKI